MPDGEALIAGAEVGLGFEVVEDGAEAGVGGERVVVAEVIGEEPIAEGEGAEEDDLETAGGGDGDPEEGPAVGGGEGEAALGNADELVKVRHTTTGFSMGKMGFRVRKSGTD